MRAAALLLATGPVMRRVYISTSSGWGCAVRAADSKGQMRKPASCRRSEEWHGAEGAGADAAGAADLEGRFGRDAAHLGGAFGVAAFEGLGDLVVVVGEAEHGAVAGAAELGGALVGFAPEAFVAGDVFAFAGEPLLGLGRRRLSARSRRRWRSRARGGTMRGS